MDITQLEQMVTALGTAVPKTGISVTYPDRVITIPISEGDTDFDGIIDNLKSVLNTKKAALSE